MWEDIECWVVEEEGEGSVRRCERSRTLGDGPTDKVLEDWGVWLGKDDDKMADTKEEQC